jgi:hypothetical protein
MNTSKIAIFAFAAALLSFATATEVSARAIDESAAAQNSLPSLHGDRLALNPQPLPPFVDPNDEDGHW